MRKPKLHIFSAYHVNRHDVKYQKQRVHSEPTASWHLPGVGFISCCSNYLARGVGGGSEKNLLVVTRRVVIFHDFISP